MEGQGVTRRAVDTCKWVLAQVIRSARVHRNGNQATNAIIISTEDIEDMDKTSRPCACWCAS